MLHHSTKFEQQMNGFLLPVFSKMFCSSLHFLKISTIVNKCVCAFLCISFRCAARRLLEQAPLSGPPAPQPSGTTAQGGPEGTMSHGHLTTPQRS